MKKVIVILSVVIFGAMQATSQTNNTPNPREISILDGATVIEVRKSESDFLCIVIRVSDKNVKKSSGGCLEVKKRGEYYMTMADGKRYRSFDKMMSDYWKDDFKRFYRDDKKYGKKVWSAFVKEGGLQLFIDITKEFCDDEFLNSPFDEIYG